MNTEAPPKPAENKPEKSNDDQAKEHRQVLILELTPDNRLKLDNYIGNSLVALGALIVAREMIIAQNFGPADGGASEPGVTAPETDKSGG